jgi:hypothetical protein
VTGLLGAGEVGVVVGMLGSAGAGVGAGPVGFGGVLGSIFIILSCYVYLYLRSITRITNL